MITTIDPKLTEMGLPQYPPLPGNVEPQRIEEIRRTVYVANLDPTVTPEQVLNFFSQVQSLQLLIPETVSFVAASCHVLSLYKGLLTLSKRESEFFLRS